MSADLINQLIDSLVEQVLARLGPRLIEWLDARRIEKKEDPLLTVREIAKKLRLGETTVRQLVDTGALIKAPGLLEIRVRESVVDNYGTSNPTKRK